MLGLDTFDEVDKMRHLSSLRMEEIKICAVNVLHSTEMGI